MASPAPSAPCRTGISGLDEILCGGLPRHRFYLIQGDPGVGKTTLALQFLLENARDGKRCLYITLSETKEELLETARSHKWSLDPLELMELTGGDKLGISQNTLFHPSEVELTQTAEILREKVESFNPDFVVLDSLSEFRLMAQEPLRYRRQMLSFKQYFAARGTTVLLLDDRTSGDSDLLIQSIAHGVIWLRRMNTSYGAERRQISIMKMRGLKFQDGSHDYSVETGGLEVFPRLIASSGTGTFKNEAVSSNIKGLDELLSGGLVRGTSNLFMGPAGTGKSTVAAQFAYALAERGEKSFICIFDENLHTYLKRARDLGMDLEKHISAGRIRLQLVEAASLSPGEMVFRVRKAVDEDGVRMVVIDSLNGYLNAMPEERFLTLQLHEMLSYLNQQGVVSVLVMAQQGLVGEVHSPADLTYLADTVLLLRYFEFAGSIKKAISIIKKRTGGHEDSIREINTRAGRIEVGLPLRDFQGILRGVPEFLGHAEAIMGMGDAVGR
jgi:circadian clock protein KaiC